MDADERNTLKRFIPQIKVDENGCWIWQGAKTGNRYKEILEMRSMFDAGTSVSKIHRLFKERSCRAAIDMIVRRKNWKHLP